MTDNWLYYHWPRVWQALNGLPRRTVGLLWYRLKRAWWRRYRCTKGQHGAAMSQSLSGHQEFCPYCMKGWIDYGR
jgi:hypothetical protein